MKIPIFTLLLLLSSCQWLAAQCPTGSITFTSQAQIDSFHLLYPGCQDLPDNLVVYGNDISNLNGLLGITSVGGNLRIGGVSFGLNDFLTNLNGLDSLHSIGESLTISKNELLESLAGLDNLASIGEDLTIIGNSALSDISSLKNITSIPGGLAIGEFTMFAGGIYFGNPSLPNLTGLENIQSVEHLEVLGNYALTDLAGLSSLKTVSSSISIIENTSLTSLAGLQEITSVPGQLVIGNCPLTNLTELENITSAGSIYLYGLDSITNLTFLTNIDSIPGTLFIGSFDNDISGQPIPIGNDNLTDLSGLGNIVHVGSLGIIGNASLLSLNGLNQLSSITNDLVISGNPVLNDLSLLSFVTSLSGSLSIEENPVLPDLNAFENLTSIAGSLSMGFSDFFEVGVCGNASVKDLNGLRNLKFIGESLSIVCNDSLQTLCGLNEDLIIVGGITIAGNPSLSSCHVEAICNFFTTPPIYATILENALGCDSLSEVQAACAIVPADCTTATESFIPDENDALVAFPNPASDFLSFQLPETASSLNVQVFDAQGRLVLLANGQQLDVHGLAAGMYSLRVVVGERVFVGKFVKQ